MLCDLGQLPGSVTSSVNPLDWQQYWPAERPALAGSPED